MVLSSNDILSASAIKILQNISGKARVWFSNKSYAIAQWKCEKAYKALT